MPLSLSRKPGQTIRIGDDVRIVIRSTSRGRVVLAIDAPPEVRVLRGERDQDQAAIVAADRRGNPRNSL